MDESTINALIKAFESKVKSELSESPELELVVDSEIDEEIIEMKFSLRDIYNKKLFIALARKHGYKPYRYPKQKHTTVILKGKRSFLDKVLWPQYVSLSQDLGFFLEQVTNELVRKLLAADHSDLPHSEGDSNPPR